MSNIRLINETNASSVAKVTINDLFSADYDIYKLQFTNLVQATSTATFSFIRFLNASGSEVSNSNYDTGKLVTRAGGAFSHTFYNGQSYLWNQIYNVVNESDFGGGTMYVFNPYSSSEYTFTLSQSFFRYNGTSGGTTGHEGYKSVGVLKETTRLTGACFTNDTGNFTSFGVRVYGIREDS